MSPDEMLAVVAETGEDSGSDYNDGLDGWFGFTVAGDLLTVTWTPAGEDGGAANDHTEVRSWRLISTD